MRVLGQLPAASAGDRRNRPRSLRPARMRLPSRRPRRGAWDESSPTNEDVQWMRRALAEAAKGRGTVEPNPTVGAVVVRDDSLVAAGHTSDSAEPTPRSTLSMKRVKVLAGPHSTSRSSRVAISARRRRARTRYWPPGSARVVVAISRSVSQGQRPRPGGHSKPGDCTVEIGLRSRSRPVAQSLRT